MRKLKLQVQLSIDGFMAGPNGEMDWMIWNWDDELKEYVRNLTEPVDTILLGRKLAEGFIPTWASRLEKPGDEEPAFVQKMNEIYKVVFTKTLDASVPTINGWNNTVVENGNLLEEVQHLKSKPGNDIIVYGGGNFISNLISENLIDEFHLFINPVALGKGMPIFNELKQQRKMELKKAIPFKCGVVLLNYSSKL
jgi:dihydrofolate reductase